MSALKNQDSATLSSIKCFRISMRYFKHSSVSLQCLQTWGLASYLILPVGLDESSPTPLRTFPIVREQVLKLSSRLAAVIPILLSAMHAACTCIVHLGEKLSQDFGSLLSLLLLDSWFTDYDYMIIYNVVHAGGCGDMKLRKSCLIFMYCTRHKPK